MFRLHVKPRLDDSYANIVGDISGIVHNMSFCTLLRVPLIVFLLRLDVNICTTIGCINKNTFLGDKTANHGFIVIE